jgi:Family of unknown function (DUF6292)
MANEAEPYIAAVADACAAAGLHVVDYQSDDIDPRDGVIELTLDPDADLDGDDWAKGRTLSWDEERGWLIGRPKDPHGELTGICYFGGEALPDPLEVAELARKLITGKLSRDERREIADPVRHRSRDDDDGFDDQLAAYRFTVQLAAEREAECEQS